MTRTIRERAEAAAKRIAPYWDREAVLKLLLIEFEDLEIDETDSAYLNRRIAEAERERDEAKRAWNKAEDKITTLTLERDEAIKQATYSSQMAADNNLCRMAMAKMRDDAFAERDKAMAGMERLKRYVAASATKFANDPTISSRLQSVEANVAYHEQKLGELGDRASIVREAVVRALREVDSATVLTVNGDRVIRRRADEVEKEGK